MSSEGLLFDTSPLEGDGQKKRKTAKRPAKPQASFVRDRENAVLESPAAGFIMTLDNVPCWQCGAPADLAEVLIIDGRKKWRVACGWLCLVSWLIDPIPGLLEVGNEKREKSFVVREGRYKGKTFDEIDAMGKRKYIEDIAELSKDRRASAAAKAWLAANAA